jgi:ornithine cyclodeaminase/alanine dehydrogenase-like protein (mu-crystallin family)
MRLYTPAEIRAKVRLSDLLEPNRQAFCAYSNRQAQNAISFLNPNGGEVHIKSGFMASSPIFAVKVSAGFAGNAAAGLPVWDGLIAVFDATTGAPLALLQDEGLLTDWRTAIAGAIATQALAQQTKTLGMVGTGLQGYYQPLAHKLVCKFERLLLWGRDVAKTAALAERLTPELPDVEIQVCNDLEPLVRQSDTIVTVTSSRKALIQADWLHTGQHITAVGADAKGKLELHPDVLQRADVIVVDSLEVNRQYGDVAAALEMGAIQGVSGELGQLLEGRITGREDARQITIAKLVGLGVQDVATAAAALAVLSEKSNS